MGLLCCRIGSSFGGGPGEIAEIGVIGSECFLYVFGGKRIYSEIYGFKNTQKANADLLENQKGMGLDDIKLNEYNEQNESLKMEVNRLRNEVATYQDQQKEDKMKIAELEKKVKKLEFETLDLSNYMEWNGNQILFWMMSLDDGRFEKYEEMLKSALSENDVIGEDLSDITALTLKAWGMTDRKDAKGLSVHIQDLIQQNGPHGAVMMNVAAAAAPKENEGAPTAFIGR